MAFDFRNLKMRKPYRVMVHIPTGRGAAYDQSSYGLTVDAASAELVRYTLAHHEQREPWKMDSRLPLRSWVKQEELAECELFWVQGRNSTRESVAAIPDA